MDQDKLGIHHTFQSIANAFSNEIKVVIYALQNLSDCSDLIMDE